MLVEVTLNSMREWVVHHKGGDLNQGFNGYEHIICVRCRQPPPSTSKRSTPPFMQSKGDGMEDTGPDSDWRGLCTHLEDTQGRGQDTDVTSGSMEPWILVLRLYLTFATACVCILYHGVSVPLLLVSFMIQWFYVFSFFPLAPESALKLLTPEDLLCFWCIAWIVFIKSLLMKCERP